MMMLTDLLRLHWLQAFVVGIVVASFLRKFLPIWKQYKITAAAFKDIPGLPTHWLAGHAQKMRPSKEAFDRRFETLKKFPKCQPAWLGPFIAFLQGYHPDFVKTVLTTDAPKDDIAYRYLRSWIGDGLLTSRGAKWKRNRRLLTPAFHFDILKKYLNCMNCTTSELLSIWSENYPNNGFLEVEMFHDVSRMTLDSILRCILSKESGCQRDENNDYLKAVKCISESVMARVFNPLFLSDFVFYLTSLGRAYKRALAVAHKYTSRLIDERQRYGPKSDGNLDFLDVLLNAKDDQGKGLSSEEICDEVDTFVFEGHDTVSSGISWAMYNLAAYPEFQNKCRQEVIEVLNGRANVEWGDLSKLSFLTRFIKESMRLYPPVFGMARTINQPLKFSRGFGKDLVNTSLKLPNGSAESFSKIFPPNINFVVSIYLLHRNPHVWENPLVFDPERFTPENIAKRSAHAYVPFSAGPRNCIGQNFAMNEMKVMLAKTLTKFRIHLNEKHPPPEIQPALVLRSKAGIHLKLEQIADDSQ